MEYPIDFKLPCLYYNQCDHADLEKCKKTCHQYLKMTCLITNCGMPNAERYTNNLKPSDADKAAYERLQEIKDNIVQYVKEGIFLTIFSQVSGVSKSSRALKMMYSYFHHIWYTSDFTPKGYFLYVPDFLLSFKDNDYKKTAEYKNILSLMKTVDILILDDLLNQQLYSTEQLLFLSVLHTRKHNSLATIITGKHKTFDEYVPIIGEDISNLILDSEMIALKGGNQC